jgi:hypothetical protein
MIELVGPVLSLLVIGMFARAAWLGISRWVLARLAEIPRELRAPLLWTLALVITILAASAATTPTGLAPPPPEPQIIETGPSEAEPQRSYPDDYYHEEPTVLRI